MTCSDCNGPARAVSDAALIMGSSVREPGEILCPGCSSTRMLMVRAVAKIPNNLADIKALRAPSVRATKGKVA